jgi:hypothetical protein
MRYTFRGRKRCLSLGEHTEVFGPAEARRVVAEHKAAIGRDVDPLEEREKRRADLTFAEFAEQHLPLARARKKTVSHDEYWIRKRLNPAIGSRPPKSLSQKDVAQLCLKEKERTSATGANHLLAIFKVVMSTAVKLWFADKNPCTGSSDALLGASEGIVEMLEEAETEAARKRTDETENATDPEEGTADPEHGEKAVG